MVLPLGKTSVSLYNINMKKVKKPAPVLNRRAHYDYNLSDKVEVGMVLTGPQVRLIRDRHAQRPRAGHGGTGGTGNAPGSF